MLKIRDPFFPSDLSFLERDCLSYACHRCILEADNLFDFAGSQMKRNFAPRLQVSPTTDLCELEDEIWILSWHLDEILDLDLIME